MNKLLLGVAFLGLTIVSCQNPSKNTVEAGGAPEVCPMTGNACEMDKGACDEMGACPMGEECDMDGMKADCDGDCDMEGMKADCDMEGMKADCDMEGMKADCDGDCDMEGKSMDDCPMGGMSEDCDMEGMEAKSDCCSGKE